MSAKPEVIVFTPTPNEFAAVKRQVEAGVYHNFTPRVVESGPGKINATFKMAAEVLPLTASGKRPAFVLGSGTSGSLSLELTAGDLIASSACLISDWRMEDDDCRHSGVYGQFVYHPVTTEKAEEMTITCNDPIVEKLMVRLTGKGFTRGRMLTSDTFVAGRNNKLSLGRDFDCLTCDMESGAFAFTAQHLLGGIPWFNLRVVADTLDESLHDYFNKEIDMVEILGTKTAQALTALDELM